MIAAMQGEMSIASLMVKAGAALDLQDRVSIVGERERANLIVRTG